MAVAGGAEVVDPSERALERRARSGDRHARCKVAGVDAADDTLLMAYLIEPARSTYELRDLGPEYGIELSPSPRPTRRPPALVVAAELPRLLAPLMQARLDERNLTALCTARSSCRSPASSPTWSAPA